MKEENLFDSKRLVSGTYLRILEVDDERMCKKNFIGFGAAVPKAPRGNLGVFCSKYKGNAKENRRAKRAGRILGVFHAKY